MRPFRETSNAARTRKHCFPLAYPLRILCAPLRSKSTLIISPDKLPRPSDRSARRPASPSASTLPSCSTVTFRAMRSMNDMSCSTTTSECGSGERRGRAPRCARSRRRSCPRRVRRAAAASAPASAACRSRAIASGRATATRRDDRRNRAGGSRSSVVAIRSRSSAVSFAKSVLRTRLSAFIESSRFSNAVWCSKIVGFWNLRPIPACAICGFR